MKFTTYLLTLLFIGAVLSALVWLLKLTPAGQYYLPIHLWLPVIFVVITATEHRFLYNTIRKHPTRFTQAFMAASSIKLLLILAVTVIYLLIDKSQVLAFVSVLFINYIIFTIFEVKALLRLVKKSD